MKLTSKSFESVFELTSNLSTDILARNKTNLCDNAFSNYLPWDMVRIRSHKRRFSGPPHFLPEIVNRNERVILETHNSLDHSSQLEGQLTNKYIILNYPYDIINDS